MLLTVSNANFSSYASTRFSHSSINFYEMYYFYADDVYFYDFGTIVSHIYFRWVVFDD